jgi:uncharacterized membrane protein YhhN
VPVELGFVLGAAVGLGLHLFFEYRGRGRAALAAKAVVSALFVAAALTCPYAVPGYFYPVVVGLAFCLTGDVLLAVPGRKAFLAGLVSFLLGHVCYIVAFFGQASPDAVALAGTLGCAVASVLVFKWLAPHLGEMRVPVMAYVVVITTMMAGALAVAAQPFIPSHVRGMVLAGAACFYVSDVFVARDRFVSQGFANRLVGLPLYYAGQFLLAFSVCAMR